MNTGQVVRALRQALEAAPYDLPSAHADELDFRSSAGAAEQLTLRNACVCAGAEFRVARDLDLSPEILVIDYGLGTIGLVHMLGDSKAESLADLAKRHVDQATYLRHLLVTEGVSAQIPDFRLGYTVESVLAIDTARMHEMVQVVREIAAHTRFLHATGLNLLPIGAGGTIDPVEVRRAFAWLLPATRRRLTGCASRGAPHLRSLELSNYRLPGQRQWTLAPNRVHLLHGANGTGKSSIAEALELVVTGAVERIRNRPDSNYDEVIRNAASDPGESAGVTLSLSDDSHRSYTVIATGVAQEPMAKGLPVTAFRLDQTAMDQLVRADSQQRARALTRAFFPGDAYEKLEAAQHEFNKAFRDLPPELQQQIRAEQPDPNKWHTAVAARLKWVEETTVSPAHLVDCLPLKRELLEVLARIVPEIKDHLDALTMPADRTAFEGELKQLDEALGRMRPDARHYRDAVVQARSALQRLATWAPSSDAISREYSDVLRSWSDRVALSDVLQKHLEISRTLFDARTGSWMLDAPATGLLAASVDDLKNSLPVLTKLTSRYTDEQRLLFKQLQGASEASGSGAHATPSSLTANEILDLNLIGAWFGRLEATPPKEMLGEAIQAAISGAPTAGYGSLTIGSGSWTTRFVEFLAPLEPALNDLVAFEPAAGAPAPAQADKPAVEPLVYRGPLARLHAYRNSLETARQVSDASRLVEEALMNRLAEHGLNEALDEVIALFTPARWAYEGLFVSAQVSDGKVGVDLLTAKTRKPAEMRLNTAELNLIVLGIYLMCGPTIDNPLGTLVLDDPLQNMDELTSATVARGLAKVAALFPEGWQLILMFHGEEDLEAFRREVPASVYYLPWLGPSNAGHASSHAVRLDTRSTLASTPRHLADVVERRVRKRPPASV
jgi:hypothetical protein